MAHPIDLHVGTRLRILRKMRAMSQVELGQLVELTFQQIQKYERGANRISASKLFQFAVALDVRIHDFFDGLDENVVESDVTTQAPISDEALCLAAAFENVEDSAARKQILQLVNVLSSGPAKAA